MTNPLIAQYLVPNAAWVVMFGETILQLEDKSGPLGRYFGSLDELDVSLALCGLKRGKGNRIGLV
jgi:hypothetical protein